LGVLRLVTLAPERTLVSIFGQGILFFVSDSRWPHITALKRAPAAMANGFLAPADQITPWQM